MRNDLQGWVCSDRSDYWGLYGDSIPHCSAAADRRSISVAGFTIILNNPKSIPWSCLLFHTSGSSSLQCNYFLLFIEAEIKMTFLTYWGTCSVLDACYFSYP